MQQTKKECWGAGLNNWYIYTYPSNIIHHSLQKFNPIMCASVLLDRIRRFFLPQPFAKHFWWGKKVTEGTFPACPPLLPGAAFCREAYLELPCTFFHPASLQIYPQNTFLSLRRGQSTEKVCQAKQADSGAKIPQLCLQIKWQTL